MAFFDLRLPLGWLFVLLGLLLLGAGCIVEPISSDGHSLDLNINLISGCVLLLFGLMSLGFAWRSHARSRSLR